MEELKEDIKKIIVSLVLFIAGTVVYKGFDIKYGIILLAVAYVIAGFELYKEAIEGLIHGEVFGEEFLMVVATLGAIVCKEYTEAVAVLLFFMVGEAFEEYAEDKSRKSIESLMEIRPDFARVIRDGKEEETEPSNVHTGDIISVNAGERIPLDGIIIEGNSTLDTAALTGESLPVSVAEGNNVSSGCINLSGVLKIKVTSEFENSTVSNILRLVEEASDKKSKSEQFITKFARVYTPVVVLSAVLLAVIGSIITKRPTEWIYRAMSFLLISCPCALVISVPLSFFGGIGGAGKKGVLIKGGNYMDTLTKVDTLVMDKTGTLTKGFFEINSVVSSDFFESEYKEGAKEKLLEYAAVLESISNHPIAVSIVKSFSDEIDKNRIGDAKEFAGKGVGAVLDGKQCYAGNRKLMLEVLKDEQKALIENINSDATTVFLSVDGIFAGYVTVADKVKEGAAEFVKNAKTNGINRIVVLTGDNKATAEKVCNELGISDVYAELFPADKVSTLEKVMRETTDGKVAFVGDGINDAPVLARADIGIAMGGMGSDAAIEASDVVIMTDELSKIFTALKVSKKTISIAKENIVFAISVKILVLILAAVGIATMWAAVFADVGVTVLAVLNSFRAMWGKNKSNRVI